MSFQDELRALLRKHDILCAVHPKVLPLEVQAVQGERPSVPTRWIRRTTAEVSR